MDVETLTIDPSLLSNHKLIRLAKISDLIAKDVNKHIEGRIFVIKRVDNFQPLKKLLPNIKVNCILEDFIEINDADLEQLHGIHSLYLGYNCHVTDAGLVHLKGIHSLFLGHDTHVTDVGLVHLKGIHTLKIQGPSMITDAGLVHLKGIRSLHLGMDSKITDAGLVHLDGIRAIGLPKNISGPNLDRLKVMGCNVEAF
jgi:hypothetical protein